MTRHAARRCSLVATLAMLCAAALLGTAAPVRAQEAGTGAEPRWSWQRQHAKVLPTGNLEWTPRPFVFEKGESVRYIDFEAGDDSRDGTTRETAWKHHPWDADAAGRAADCRGIHTYVFKGGVVYRGALRAAESGKPGNPIRLTCDPTWGRGPAELYGSTAIRGGWKRATAEDAPGIPEPGQVWYQDVGVDYDPDLRTPPSGDRDHGDSTKFSSMWQVADGKVTRLHIARDPDYKLSDPYNPTADWHTWDSFKRAGSSDSVGTLTSAALKGLGDRNALDEAIIWTQHSGLMGTPHKVVPKNYDPEAGSVYLASGGGANHGRLPRSTVHFFVENVAQFLDAPGEFFFDGVGPKAGRLYLRPADGVDPNEAVYEVAQVRFILWIQDRHDIVVSGLQFRYNDPDDGTNGFTHPRQVAASPCVRIVGNCADIAVRNCTFTHVANAVVAFPRPNDEKVEPAWSATYWWRGSPETAAGDIGPFADDVMDGIYITDNDVLHAERAGAIFAAGGSETIEGAGFGRLGRLEILRNRVVHTGFRPDASGTSSVPAISVIWPETCEIAGNIVDTSWGNGIFTHGGKGSGAHNKVPLTRMLIHNNQIDNTMLACNDYGGLEHFQGGPTYIYNNITRNCVGNRTFNGSELGYSLYLDGGFKCYVFNNIIAGKVKPDEPDYYNHCGYFMVFGFMDQFFNNTIYRFMKGMEGSSGNRSNIVGNLVLDCSQTFIGQNRPGDASMEFGGDTGEMGRMGIPTMAYASNVFFGNPAGREGRNDAFGYVGGVRKPGERGAPVFSGNTLEELRAALEAQDCRLATLGWMADEMPLADPADRDYRPTADSAARGRGVRYFVPWSLARTVGEWNFYRSDATPQVVLGESFYMTDEYVGRDMYYYIPRNDLVVSQCTPQDYKAGLLEDWIEGALVFDGAERTATLSHAEMTKDMEYPARGNRAPRKYDGSRRETVDMGVNNFLIEVVFRTEPGRAGGVLARKMDGAGYELSVGDDGAPQLLLQAGDAQARTSSTAAVNDGAWHHVIAEVDRAAGNVTFYVDGKAAGSGPLGIAKDASLANTADFVVGQGFAGALDFLRVCRSTLAESKTSIEELYAWEFDGPFLHDFRGVRPADRDAGAVQGPQ